MSLFVRFFGFAMIASISLATGLMLLADIPWIWGYLASINLIIILYYGYDKQAAMDNKLRIPERSLIWLSSLGGSVGAYWAAQKFRHKTLKQDFNIKLGIIILVQAGLLALLFKFNLL